MSVRMVLKSSDTLVVHPDNQPWDFRVRLPAPLPLVGYWTVELTEFYTDNVIDKEIYVYCGVCDDTIVGEKQVPLLRRIYLEDKKNTIFTTPYQVPLRIADLSDIHIYIKDAQDKNASFITGSLCVTLVFRRHPM